MAAGRRGCNACAYFLPSALECLQLSELWVSNIWFILIHQLIPQLIHFDSFAFWSISALTRLRSRLWCSFLILCAIVRTLQYNCGMWTKCWAESSFLDRQKIGVKMKNCNTGNRSPSHKVMSRGITRSQKESNYSTQESLIHDESCDWMSDS